MTDLSKLSQARSHHQAILRLNLANLRTACSNALTSLARGELPATELRGMACRADEAGSVLAALRMLSEPEEPA
jgi:hypothetical protein